jgi:hypothetical protein
MLAVWNDLLIGLLSQSPGVIPITANVVTFQQKFSADADHLRGAIPVGAPMLAI